MSARVVTAQGSSEAKCLNLTFFFYELSKVVFAHYSHGPRACAGTIAAAQLLCSDFVTPW